MGCEKKGISGYDGYLRHQGQTVTKPAIGGPGPPHGLALPPELLSTIHLSIINHSDPLREGWKIEKNCFRMSNIVYPWQSHRKEHAWFQANGNKYKNWSASMAVGMVNTSLFCVLFIPVIYVYYFLSWQWLMFVFKAFTNDSTRIQFDLIFSDLHNSWRMDWKWKQDQHSKFFIFFFRPFLHINLNSAACAHLNFLSAPQHAAVAVLCMQNLHELFFVWLDWKIWSVRSLSQRKFKLPPDLSELHLVWGCYKLGSLSSLWCQQNGGGREVEGLGKVSC